MPLRPFRKNPIDEAKIDLARQRLESVARKLQALGLTVTPYADPSLPVYRRNSARNAELILRSLVAYDDALSADMSRTEPKATTQRLLWRTLTSLGYAPKSDVMNLIEDRHIVEIYTLGHQQIFRNLLFFEYCSFTLEDILGGDWRELTHRSQTVAQTALTFVKLLEIGINNQTTDVSNLVPKHAVSETRGEKRKYFIQLNYASPLRQKGLPLAYLLIHEASWT